ncbi:MAG: hypothetical protein C4K58_01490 [Flavobacteriaceae bacterium]|nr:MAG: hypothetical protein C4K58_01490 [Flavobacteriaceae bacterium]
MELTGRIKKIFDAQTFPSGFRKREVVLMTQEQYPQQILVEFTQDKVDLLNNYAEDQNVKISINIRGREWINPEGVAKYFNSIVGWRIENAAQSSAPDAPMPTGAPQNLSADPGEEDPSDDLPF